MKRRRPSSRSPAAASAIKPWQEVRAAQVARARKLIADPDYPPPKVTDAVARLLAKHLRAGE